MGLTSEIAPKHEVQNKKAVLIILKSIAQVDDEWVIDLAAVSNSAHDSGSEKAANLFKKPPFLNNIWHSLHLDAFALVDILESIQFASLLMLNHTNLEDRRV
jgi:hypothetical protein